MAIFPLGAALLFGIVALIARRVSRCLYVVHPANAQAFWYLTSKGLVPAKVGRYWFRQREHLLYIPHSFQLAVANGGMEHRFDVRFKSTEVSTTDVNAFYEWWQKLVAGKMSLVWTHRHNPFSYAMFSIKETHVA